MITKYISTISKKEKISNKVYLVELTLLSPHEIYFTPGQFISVCISSHIKRSYTIASSPSIISKIKLIIDLAPGGEGSRFFEKISLNDEVSFLGPMGKFTLAKDDGEIVFLATSTGVAPFRSMIEYLIEKQNKERDQSRRKIYLYLGFRYLADIFWKKYFEDLAKVCDNFFFCLTLSQPEVSWQGNKGYIQNFIKNELLVSKDAHFYICGGGKMVTGVVDFLKNKKVETERIHFEPF